MEGGCASPACAVECQTLVALGQERLKVIAVEMSNLHDTVRIKRTDKE